MLCANDLANKDVGLLQGDVSDPYVVAYLRNASGKTLHKKQTKVVKDNLNPVWNREMFDISMYGESISGGAARECRCRCCCVRERSSHSGARTSRCQRERLD